MNKIKGFGIVQALVAAVILGFLTMAAVKMITNSIKGQKNVQNSIDFDVLKASINQVLSTPELCKNALLNSSGVVAQFGPTVSSMDKFSELRIGSNPIAKLNQNIGGGMSISKLELNDSGAGGFANGSGTIYLTEFVVEATKAAGSYGGRTLSNASNPFRLVITTNAANVIIKCDSMGGGGMPLSEQQMCAVLGGAWDAIANPKCTFAANTAKLESVKVSCSFSGPPNHCAMVCPAGKLIVPLSATGSSLGGKGSLKYANPGAISDDQKSQACQGWTAAFAPAMSCAALCVGPQSP